MIIFVVGCFTFAIADDDASQEKLDSLIKLQNETAKQIEEIDQTTKKIYKEQKNNPLENKSFGIELNPFWLFFLNEGFHLTGGFSFFNIDRDAEIAIPIVFRNDYDSDVNTFFIGGHYRYFLGNTQNGFYLSGLGEYNFTRYLALSYDTTSNEFDEHTRGNQRAGLGIGIGYRKFSYKGLYWGFSFSVGRYMWKQNDFEGISTEGFISEVTNDLLLDIELLKFGYAF